MTIRRLASLALAASLLHLNFVRADAACGEHTHVAPQTIDHATAHHMAGDGHDGHEAPPSQEPSCETPAQTDCCQALASCSPPMGASSEIAEASFVPPHEDVLGAAIEVPLSRVTTPDPPPPRA